ncbi:hypothetical protein OQA88_10572 [Cercophora sp. LCS_1]
MADLTLLQKGGYITLLTSPASESLIASFLTQAQPPPTLTSETQTIGIAALNAFLQANVTGPPLQHVSRLTTLFTKNATLKSLRQRCLKGLASDGVEPYPFIPLIELFSFAKWIFDSNNENENDNENGWWKLRVLVWWFKLLVQPSLGSASVFVRSGGWCEVPTLKGEIESLVGRLEGGELEKVGVWVMLGREGKARDALEGYVKKNGFVYGLGGRMGKRTRFQEKGTSLLVVKARSRHTDGAEEGGVKPEGKKLKDDTLLEELEFEEEEGEEWTGSLKVEDQIVLLAEATMRDAFSPVGDGLTAEEILPFAARVLREDKVNWQVYTQALLVRSRIEVHRSRTVERGVLQMQAVVDQVVVDTAEEKVEEQVEEQVEEVTNGAPAITIGDEEVNKPTSFFPAPKPTESAPVQDRLRHVHLLMSPPRWHLESELAYSWANVGSLVSALEIFKRLRLWAEVALCLASNAAKDDEGGRGSGDENKAKAVLRWRLFQRTGTSPEQDEEIDEDIDISELKEDDYHGPERSTPPSNAPRLWCILGDIENDPTYYERAWEISNHRFSRAQKSLGEYYIQQKDIVRAKEAYEKAVEVNRLSAEMWNRLGDIALRLGEFSDAAEAFGKAISCADNLVGGEDARTWSNLGSALYSLYVERVKEVKAAKENPEQEAPEQPEDIDQENVAIEKGTNGTNSTKADPATLLSQSLAAYKKGASISRDNWRIWDNVITLAARARPPAVPEILLALQNIIRIRNTEDALDLSVLRLLLNETVLSKEKTTDSGVYDPPRGSTERAVCELLETSVVPLITVRSELWELIARERVWKRDYAGAVDAAERAWRAAVGVAGSGLVPTEGGRKSWLEDESEWGVVVDRTDELVSILENYGEEVESIGAKWKGKARSAIRSVKGKAKEAWEGSAGWERLEGLLEGLK